MISEKTVGRMISLSNEMAIVHCGFRDLFLEEAYQQLVDRFGHNPDPRDLSETYLEANWLRLGRALKPSDSIGAARRYCLQTRGSIPNRFRRA